MKVTLFLTICNLLPSEMGWEYLPFPPHQHVAKSNETTVVKYSQMQMTDVLNVELEMWGLHFGIFLKAKHKLTI